MAATPSADIPQFQIGSELRPDGVSVVRVAGEVDMSHEQELLAELRRVDDADSRGIVVDLTDCEFIDSSGVRALLLSRDSSDLESPAGLSVAATSQQILRILAVMGVDKAIPIRPTVEQAAAELPR